jgi:hypothetical protein
VYVSADGIPCCQPLLIFHSAMKGDTRRKDEERKYCKDVDVLWNLKAWANKDIMLWWLKHSYQFSLCYSNLGIKREPCLLCMDAFKAYLTLAVSTVLKQQGVVLSVILGGCTGFVQPLDVSLNKLLKDLIKDEQDRHFNKNITE